MTSKQQEDDHITSINKILENYEITCVKVPEESVDEESTIEVEEKLSLIEAESEETLEEITAEVENTISEETVEVNKPIPFPTPSLRKILPENIREIEKFNKLHTLPDKFNTKIDPNAIPKIKTTEPQKYIDVLAELIGCKEYKNNLPEYWVLDTLAYLLRRAQDDGLDINSQAVLILWFCEWMKEMQYFDAADRERMLQKFKDNMLSAAKFIAEECRLPTPDDIGVHYKEREEVKKSQSRVSRMSSASKHTMVTFDGTSYQCSMWDLTKIIHYIFDLFSTDYQFDLVRAIFCTSPQYTLIDAPYRIQAPKQLYVPVKTKGKKDKSPKNEKSARNKGKKEEEPNLEFLALMELKAAEEKELKETAEREKEELIQKNHILPLNMAAQEELFEKYWPTPPAQEAEGNLTAKSKTKGKKK